MANTTLSDSPTNSNKTVSGDAGNVNDKLIISVSGDGASATRAETNSLEGFDTAPGDDGNDSLSVVGVNKTEGFYLHIEDNTLRGGDGKNRLSLTGKSADAALVKNNSITAGDDSDSIKITAIGTRANSANASGNTIEAGDGNNRIDVISKASGTLASAAQLSIGAGTGNDTLNVTVQTAGKEPQAGGADARITATGNIDLGDGDNRINLKAIAADDSSITSQTVASGSGNDSLQILSKTSGKAPEGAELANSYFLTNSISLGDGNNQFKVSLQTPGNTAQWLNNSLDTGSGNDRIDVAVKTTGKGDAADANVNGAYVDLGSGDNTVKMTVQSAGDDALIRGINLSTDMGDGLFQFKAKSSGKVGDGNGADVNFDDNDFLLGGSNTIKIDLQTADDDGIMEDNYIGTTSGDDRFELKLMTQAKGGDGGGANVYIEDNVFNFGDGENTTLIKAETKGDDAGFYGNQIISGGYNDVFNLTVKTSGKSQEGGTSKAIVGSNTFENGHGENLMNILAESGGTDAGIVSNRIYGGIGDDEFHLTAKATGKAPAASSYISVNSIATYGGDNHINLISTSKVGYAALGSNTLEGGDAMDTFFLNAKAGKMGDASISQSEIKTYDGENLVSLSASGMSASVNGNVIEGGSDTLQAHVSIRGENLTFQSNMIAGGLGNDYLSIDLQTKGAILDTSENTLVSYSGDDVFVLRFDGGGDRDVADFIGSASLQGGNYVDDLDVLKIASKGQIIDFRTEISSDRIYGFDRIDLGKKNSLILDESSVRDISDADDDLFITGKGSTVDIGAGWTDYGVVNGYQHFGQAGTDLYLDTSLTVIV